MKKILRFLPFLFLPFAQADENQTPFVCYDYITEMIRSSNFPYLFPPKSPANSLIDSDDGKTIVIQVIVNKTPEEFDVETPNSMWIMGFVKYEIATQKLFNVSGNLEPDQPERLRYNKKYAKLFNQCLRSKKG